MSLLTTLLTHDQVVSPRKIDEAIQRQVISGGDIETNLLELGVIAEDTLAAYCAAVYDLTAAPRQQVLDADPVAIARVPRDLANNAQVVPLRTENGVLVLACARPPMPVDLGPVEAMCGLKTTLRVVVPFRLSWAMWRYYQVPLEARYARLAERQGALPAGGIPKVVKPASMSTPSLDRPSAPILRSGKALSALATLAAAMEDNDEEDDDAPSPSRVPPVAGGRTDAPSASTSRTPAALTSLPLSLPEARERLGLARSRDAVLEVLLDHARSLFTYAAVLLFHGDRVEGVGSRGLGAGPEQVRRLSFALSEAGMLRDVHDGASTMIARVSTAADRNLRDALERRAVTDVGLIPIKLGSRVALVLWVDKGMAPPTATVMTPIAAFAEECAQSLARMILERKHASSGRASVPPRPSVILRSGNAPTAEGRPAAQTASIRPVSRASQLPPREVRLEALRQALTGPTTPSAAPPPTPSPEPDDGPPGTRPATDRPPPMVVVPRPGPAPSSESERLVQEILDSGQLPDATAAALLGQGERALEAIFKHFPGPSSADRTQVITRLPVVSELGPLLRLVVAFRQASQPRLLALLDAPESTPEQRYFALLCLGEVVHPSALARLTSLVFDGDPATQSAATEVLRQYRRFAEFDQVGRALRAAVHDDTAPVERRRVAAQTLGALRDTDAVPTLLGALGVAGLESTAHRALMVLSRQDFGVDPAAWAPWWATAERKHRIEWLIDSLLHNDASIRHESSEELKRVTGQFFGYYFNLPRKERERAHQRYVEWWRREGSARFTDPT